MQRKLKMYIIALCYLLSAIHLFSDEQTIRKYAFDLKQPLTSISSFFIHLSPTHYYSNVVGIFLQSFFINFIFKNNLLDLLLLGIVSHFLAVVCSYFYYGTGVCGSSAFLYSWLPITICARISFMFGDYYILENILSTMIILVVFVLDQLYIEYQRKNDMILFTVVSHVGHFVGLFIGYIYWLFFLPLGIHERLNVWFQSNSFLTSSIPMSVNLHLVPFILVYLYKSKLSYFIRLDRYLRSLSGGKIRLYDYEYIKVGQTFSGINVMPSKVIEVMKEI